MKVIFLDIDGVANSERSFLASHHRVDAAAVVNDSDPEDSYTIRLAKMTVDPIAVGLINRILRRVDAHIVLSSTHRKHFEGSDDVKLQKIQRYLSQLGFDGERCIGWTPSLHKKRGEEIKHWLYERADVVDYAIVDDNYDMLPEQAKHFVQVNSAIGFSASDYRQVCNVLGEPDSSIILL